MKRLYCTAAELPAIIDRENRRQTKNKVFYNIRVKKYAGAKNYNFVVIIG